MLREIQAKVMEGTGSADASSPAAVETPGTMTNAWGNCPRLVPVTSAREWRGARGSRRPGVEWMVRGGSRRPGVEGRGGRKWRGRGGSRRMVRAREEWMIWEWGAGAARGLRLRGRGELAKFCIKTPERPYDHV